MSEAKREKIIKAIRLTWDSLDSHLDYAHTDKKLCECTHHESCGNRKFHAQCTRDYSYVIQTLTELL